MTEHTRVLVVDDEVPILNALATTLRAAGYDVDRAATASQALVLAATRNPDAIILDLVLPDGSGIDVCREIRTYSTVPILILSAIGEERQKVKALDVGADDYVTKPFGIEELLARLRALLRRIVPSPSDTQITVGEITIDLTAQLVTVSGEPVHVTPTEFELLKLFLQNVGRLLTHHTILERVWGVAYQTDANYLHVYVSRLRQKIEPDPTRPRYLITEPGAGYRLVEPAVSISPEDSGSLP